MPPKKTLKAIAAEKKKKNTAEAEDIIEKLTRETTKSSRDLADKPKKSSKETEKVTAAESKKKDTSTKSARKDVLIPTSNDNAMETNFDVDGDSAIDRSRAIGRAKSTRETTKSSRESAKSSRESAKSSRESAKSSRESVKSSRESVKSSRDSADKPKKPIKEKTDKFTASESKKKDTGTAKEIASKAESSTKSARQDQGMIPTSNNNAVPMETNLDPSLGDSAIDRSRAIERGKSVSTSQPTNSVVSSAPISKASKTWVSTTKARKPGTSKIGDYQYEIDCQKVADAIDVKDLQKHLEQHLKVNGKKNNLDGTISIHCKGNKVVIKSNTFLPKKSLRFLSKKILKRNWNIRVVSKNVHSYEYKYVGSL